MTHLLEGCETNKKIFLEGTKQNKCISSISLVFYGYICLVFHSFILLHMYINCFILLYTYFKFIHVKRF